MRSDTVSCCSARRAITRPCSTWFCRRAPFHISGSAMQVSGKIVVVTGGANGIGRALCEAFHHAGAAKVIVADLDIAAARTVAASIDGAAFKCDVQQEKDVLHVIEETERLFGPIALFCSNAGIFAGLDLFGENVGGQS